MPRVDFYILNSRELAARGEFLGRFLSKLQKLGSSAYIAVESEQAARALDAQLWASPVESFLPHAVITAGAPVVDEAFVISAQPDSRIAQEVYVNLRRSPPTGHGELSRLVEVVVQDEQVLADSRRHFAFYRAQGYTAQSHNIG